MRSGGIGLELWGGVGTLVLVFVFGLDPGEPPEEEEHTDDRGPHRDHVAGADAVISAAAAMGAAGGIDGTTNLGKRVIDHSFQFPLQICWIVTALVGIVIVAVLRRPGARAARTDDDHAVT